jgi:hypothetical protein
LQVRHFEESLQVEHSLLHGWHEFEDINGFVPKKPGLQSHPLVRLASELELKHVVHRFGLVHS